MRAAKRDGASKSTRVEPCKARNGTPDIALWCNGDNVLSGGQDGPVDDEVQEDRIKPIRFVLIRQYEAEENEGRREDIHLYMGDR